MGRSKRDYVRTALYRSYAFTLVELLVVVSIIALMVSISLPTLTRAQRNAEGVHCLANEHQLSLAWLQYALDCDDHLCKPDELTKALRRYAPMEEVYICKAVRDENASSSYGISNTMGGRERDGVTPYDKLHRVSGPSRKMLFVDVEAESQSCFWPLLRKEKQREGEEEKAEEPEYIGWKWRPWSWPPTTSLQNMTARHNNGCNMTFADGHSEYRRWRDGRTIKLIKGLIAEPNMASTDNVDLEFAVEVLTNQTR